MRIETGIKDVYRGVQGACPRRAVTHAGGTAERSERRAVGMGLKLVLHKLDGKRLCEALAFLPVLGKPLRIFSPGKTIAVILFMEIEARRAAAGRGKKQASIG